MPPKRQGLIKGNCTIHHRVLTLVPTSSSLAERPETGSGSTAPSPPAGKGWRPGPGRQSIVGDVGTGRLSSAQRGALGLAEGPD